MGTLTGTSRQEADRKKKGPALFLIIHSYRMLLVTPACSGVSLELRVNRSRIRILVSPREHITKPCQRKQQHPKEKNLDHA
jgi:hypothetical protein